jgi:hypothetical protein
MVDEHNTWKSTGDNDSNVNSNINPDVNSDIDSDTYDPYDLENYVVALEEMYNFFKYFYNRVTNSSQN